MVRLFFSFLFLPAMAFAAGPDGAANVECARVALKARAARDFVRVKSASGSDLLFRQLVASSLLPPLEKFLARLPASEVGECKTDASLAPEWSQYGELFLETRLKWKEMREALPAARVQKAADDATICRVRRSIASSDRVLSRFNAGCAEPKKFESCRKTGATTQFQTQHNELEAKLALNDRRYREKWGRELFETISCR